MRPRQSAIFLLSLALILSLTSGALAQRNRVTGPVNNKQRIFLKGNLHPRAQSDSDQGPVDASMRLSRITLVLKQSDAQQAELDQLLADQQDPSSPRYRHWLTPDEYAARFGVSQDDLDKLAAWLTGQGLTVNGVARGRNWISVGGSAADVERAFGAEIHHYLVNGARRFANATEPSIPAAFQAIVGSIHGLNDFRMKSPRRLAKAAVLPQYNSSRGTHYLAPDDIATIYNIKPLYSAGVDGSGQKIVVVGQTQIDLADIRQYRSYFNLPASDPQIILVPDSKDPGTVTDDLGEADLDLELAGAVARNASLIYVYANDVTDAAQYAIDQNLAPIITMSYGACEAQSPSSDAATYQSWARQANAQGITWFAASGDSGATDCSGGFSSRNTTSLSVDLPAAVPEVTGIGGTSFAEGSGSFWSSTADPNRASVLSYIPEVAWNDSALEGQPAASGGGASVFFSKPSWQTGTGVPSDGARDVPDVSVAASANHDGFVTFTGGKLQVVGGTSVGAPTFAGVAALLNHYLLSNGLQSTAGLGNMNPRLYALAQSASVFHDIVAGDNIINVTCTARSRNCTPGPVGFTTGAGYDQVTGLGSADIYNLVTSWNTAGASPKDAAAAPVITSVLNGASFGSAFAPGMVASIFGSQLAPSTQSAPGVPLPPQLAGVSVRINGVTAPIYYVSPGQINIQIPYGTPPSAAALIVDNNGQSASTSLSVAAAAPAIFTDSSGAPVPNASGARGQVITLFITGAGAVSPPLASGAAPASGTSTGALPKPVQLVSVQIGSVSAPIQFIGVPAGLVGVTQINYQIPLSLSPGPKSLTVTVGTVSSPLATLTVTQ